MQLLKRKACAKALKPKIASCVQETKTTVANAEEARERRS
jgi:hypothetical protein